MKKTIAILLVMAISFASIFAATDATLNLTTTVADKLDGTIVKNFTDITVANFDDASVAVSDTIDATHLSFNYTYAYRTNLTSTPNVTVEADALKSTTNANHVLAYTVSLRDAASGTPVTADDTSVTLLTAADDTNPTSGLRVVSKGFSVAVDPVGYASAPAGTYNATIRINVSAN